MPALTETYRSRASSYDRLSENRKLPYTWVFGSSFRGSPATNGPDAVGAAGAAVCATAIVPQPSRAAAVTVTTRRRRIESPWGLGPEAWGVGRGRGRGSSLSAASDLLSRASC